MATVSAKLLQVIQSGINTTKGVLKFPILYIDKALAIGDFARIYNMWSSDDSIAHLYSYEHGVFVSKQNNNETVKTLFTTDDFMISLVASENINQAILKIKYVNPNDESELLTYNSSVSVSNNQCVILSNFFLVVDINGTPFSIATSPQNMSNNMYYTRYEPNTSDEFGIYTWDGEDGYYSSGPVDAIQINVGYTIFTHSDAYDPTPDPYKPGGNSSPGGGGGNFDNTSDPIPNPSLPTISAVDTGLVSLFNPTLQQLQSLGDYLWSPLFDLTTLKKIFYDPIDIIMGLSIIPFALPETSISQLYVGNVGTGIYLNKLSKQFYQLDCGELAINEYWGAYLDYSPYTTIQIFLPYIGYQELRTDDVMNTTIKVIYKFDVVSGSCLAEILVNNNVMYQFNGQCGITIPITSNDWRGFISDIINLSSQAVLLTSSTANNTAQRESTIANKKLKSYEKEGRLASLRDSQISRDVNSVQSMDSVVSSGIKPVINRSGIMSSSIGFCGVQKPYLIITRPRQCLPPKQNKFTGYPIYDTVKLSDISGYTEVENIKLSGIHCVEGEYDEILDILKTGVIL